MTVDFITFCHPGDAPKLHAPNQLNRQVESNRYDFNNIVVIHQNCIPTSYPDFTLDNVVTPVIANGVQINGILLDAGVDIAKEQYHSPDKAHYWKYHVVNHLFGATLSHADYIVFADADCWMKKPIDWISGAIWVMETYDDCFIVSPNDGEPARKTLRMSQQMFLCRRTDFLRADWNQPGWDGNPHVTGGPFPEYFSLLEGRMEIYCKHVNKFRYVLESKYRYWHHNRDNEAGLFECDYSKY